MDVEQLPGAVLLTAICILAAMGLWYLSIRRGSLKMKQFAVMVAAIPVLVVGLNLAAYALRRSAHPVSSRLPRTRLTIPVTNGSARHQLELRPKIRGVNPPTMPGHLRFALRAPNG